jgi:hypothetical protein
MNKMNQTNEINSPALPSHSDRPSSHDEVECPGFLIQKFNLQGRREKLILLELRVESLKEDA